MKNIGIAAKRDSLADNPVLKVNSERLMEKTNLIKSGTLRGNPSSIPLVHGGRVCYTNVFLIKSDAIFPG